MAVISLFALCMSIGNAAADGATPNSLNPGGGLACGPELTCDAQTQYCYVMLGGPTGVPPGYRCNDVHNAEFPVTCKTIPDIGIGCECTESDSGVTVTCTAP
jgi:hypothetical protein